MNKKTHLEENGKRTNVTAFNIIKSHKERGFHLVKDTTSKPHVDFCSTDTAGGLDNKKRRYAPRGGVEYRLFLWGFPKGACPHLAHDFACKV